MQGWHLIGHLVIALLVGLASYFKTNNPLFILLSLFVSFAIDLDHLFDYWQATGINLNIKKFFEIDYFKINKKVFVPFHSWELIGFIIVLGLLPIKLSLFFLTIGFALGFHIAWDSFSYKIKFFDYFLLYRILNGFQMNCGA